MRLILPLLAACGAVDTDPAADAPTWHADAGPIVADRCAGCHRPGDIAPIPLTSYEEAYAARTAVRAAVDAGRMPPWPPSADCNQYHDDRSLTEDERRTLLAWVDGGAPEGDPDDAPEAIVPQPGFEPDVVLDLPEAFTPQKSPDDYRCQMLDWTPDAPSFVTGLQVLPDRTEMVHHVLVFQIPESAVERYVTLDEEEAGPGWTCFGGPGGSVAGEIDLGDLAGGQRPDIGLRIIGSWVPGTTNPHLPAGTGLRIHPGERLIVQVHYNTTADDPQPDQSALALALADEVDRPATNAPLVDIAWVLGLDILGGDMRIPAGAKRVTHATSVEVDGPYWAPSREELGLADDAPLVIHSVNHHMHLLGTSGRITVERASGGEDCLLDLPRWDFDWQGSYALVEPVTVFPGDRVSISCTWDNEDGTSDVYWGEGTNDEMCLGGAYVTGVR